MEITLVCYTKAQFLERYDDITAGEFEETYGRDAVKVYWAEKDDEEGAFVGVQCEDGSCNVYGLNMDEEYVTFSHMVARLVGEFM